MTNNKDEQLEVHMKEIYLQISMLRGSLHKEISDVRKTIETLFGSKRDEDLMILKMKVAELCDEMVHNKKEKERECTRLQRQEG